jgi:hypothetical protein
MDARTFDMGDIDIAWCPGCGNFPILKILKQALAELQIEPTNLVVVSGIGQAAKIPHYFRTNCFDGLHGRALPPATAIKAANPGLTVIAESGDGDMYGEGGNHFVHTIRRNTDITNIVHNNMVYGLTKGQASPTSQLGFKTPVQVAGVFLEPFNPLAVAIALDASFVARAFAGDIKATRWWTFFSRALPSTESILTSGSRSIAITSKNHTSLATGPKPSRGLRKKASCRSVSSISTRIRQRSKRTSASIAKTTGLCTSANSMVTNCVS